MLRCSILVVIRLDFFYFSVALRLLSRLDSFSFFLLFGVADYACIASILTTNSLLSFTWQFATIALLQSHVFLFYLAVGHTSVATDSLFALYMAVCHYSVATVSMHSVL